MKTITFCLLTASILLYSCTGFNKVRVDRTNFEEEVQRTQNLVFTFNKELVPDTADLNKWDSTRYILFEPDIPGKFMWTGKKELTFSPSGSLAPASEYKAYLQASLLRRSSIKGLDVDTDPLSFHTPLLSVDGVNSFWALSSDPLSRVEVHLLVNLNNPVTQQQIRSYFKVRIKDKDIPFTIVSQPAEETVEIALSGEWSGLEEGTRGEVIIGAGLRCTNSNTSTKESIRTEFLVPSKDNLVVNEIITGFNQGKGVITVLTNQPVLSEGLSANISIDPPIAFTAELISNGFTITGDFSENHAYVLRISSKIKSVFNRELGEDHVETVAFGALEPYIGFVEKDAAYLSSRGNRNMAVQIINVPEVRVSVFRIFENNIQHYMRQGKSWDYVFEGDEYYDYSGYSFDENYGKPVMSRTIQTRSLPRSGNFSLLNLDLEMLQFNDPFKGLYVVKVESTNKRWLQDSQLLSLSDMGMIVKQGSDHCMVFINSLKDAEPMKGVRVDFISTNNQKIHSAVTDSKGVAVFSNMKKTASGFQLGMVSARYESDFNFILTDQSRLETSRFDVGGKRVSNMEYDASLYGERDLYRPGDSVHVNLVVRTLKWEVVKGIPVKIRLVAPNGKEYITLRKQLNNQGAAEAAFYIPRQSMTGVYILEAFSANNVLLSSRRISVEEFIPDRIKVAVNTDREQYRPGEKVQIGINALNLYGTPAPGKKVESELRLARRVFQPREYPGYQFGIQASTQQLLSSVAVQSTTDASGNSSLSLTIPEYHHMGLIEGSLFTTIFDETGRPVNRLKKLSIATQEVFFGVKEFDQWVSTRKPLNFRFVSADRTGKGLSSALSRVEVVFYRYETVIERGYNRYNYISQREESVVFARDIAIRGTGTDVAFTPVRSGEYEVRIRIPGSDTYVARTFFAYGSGDTDFSSFEVNKQGEISITSDKASYQPGDKAKLLFKAPFDGKMIVAVEQNNVLEYKYLTLENKSASYELDITREQLPNIYIHATGFRKVLEGSVPLTVAHGIISLKVDEPSFRLKPLIKAPEKSRSGVSQQVKVLTTPGAEVTIAVVDEGILQVTDFKTPDPYGWFYGKRALEVTTADIYGQLYSELRPGSSVAGGEAFDLSRRINPLTSERVKLVSLWSGILKANQKGECTYTINIPQFSGALRVMAVAYSGNKFGSSEHLIRVADPVVISTSLPRFLSPGDKLPLVVNLTNTTAAAARANVSVKLGGPLQLQGPASIQATPGPGKQEQVVFSLQAGANIGSGKVKVMVQAMGQQFIQELEIPVRPLGGLSYITGAGVLKGGTTGTINARGDLIPSSVRSELTVSESPAARLKANLTRLMRYPYGCLEQTVSVAFPQIYLKDLIKITRGTSADSDANPDYNVQQAILKVESMQLYNGGFPLWENGGVAALWPSIYAVHFLFEADKAGFEVNRKVLEGGFRFLEQKARERETATWFYRENGQQKSRTVPRQEIFYAAYVLALADRPVIPVMNYYKTQLAQLTPESRYLLAAAYLLSGDRRTYQSVLPRSFGPEQAEAATGGSMGSYLRDVAISLNALLEADPSNPQVIVLMNVVIEELGKTGRYFSTQEDAFALLAVGKQARKAGGTQIKAQVRIDQKQVAQFTAGHQVIRDDFLNKQLSLSTSGNGSLYYSYEISGINKGAPSPEEDHSLKVRKSYFDINGNPLPGTSFRQNDLVVVRVTLVADQNRNIENVAITDMLPACFEIENSRLVAERELSWAKNRAVPDYLDIRDDRISFFTTAEGVMKTFYYAVRVVSKGTFTNGPVQAAAMYNGAYRSQSGVSVITVE